MNEKSASSFTEWVALFFSSTCFSGFLLGLIFGRRGSGGGTIGALIALVLQFLLLDYSAAWIVTITIASFLVGLAVIGPAEKLMLSKWGPRRRHTGEITASDFNETNIDEFHGLFLSALPIWFIDSSKTNSLVLLVIAFIAFRIFDAKKPWPIKQIEEFYKNTAFGIMIDDTAAAIPSAGIVLIMSIFI